MAKFPKTALDLHNHRTRVNRAISLLERIRDVPDVQTRSTQFFDLATIATDRVGGITILYGISENAAANALHDLSGYYAWINGRDRYVLIDHIDFDRGLLLCYDASPETGTTMEHLVSIPLRQVRSVWV